MGKLLRIVLAFLGLLLLTLVITVVALPFIVDPNDFKGDIARAVEESTGRQLHIDGEIQLAYFPWLALEVGGLSLANAEGFDDTPFARVDQARVGIQLLPLLSQQVRMSTLSLHGLHLNLARDAQGRNNWDDLAGPPAGDPTSPPAEPPPGEAPGDQQGAPALAALAIDGIEIRDAQLRWDDAQAGQHYHVQDLDLNLGAIGFDREIPVELTVAVSGNAAISQAAMELGGRVSVDPALRRFAISDLALRSEATGDDLPGGQLAATLAATLQLDLDAQRLQIAELVIKTAGLVLRAKVHGSGVGGETPRFTGSLQLEEFSPRALLVGLDQAVPETSDPTTLARAALNLDFDAGLDDASLSDLVLTLDDSTLKGSASVRGLADPDTRFTLALDRIDLDRYLPPATADGPPATPAEAAAGGAAQLPLDTLRALKLDGELRIGELRAFRLDSRDILIRLQARDGQLRVHPAGASLYEGQYQGDIGLDARGEQLRISLNESLKGIQAGPLLADLLGEQRLSGRADLAARLTAVGMDPAQIRRSLNGDLQFSFTNGAVQGINLAALLRRANAALKGQAATAEPGPQQTDFTALSGSATITNGLLRNEDLSAHSPLLRVSGAGEVNLPAETLDYTLTTKLVGTLEGQGGAGLEELKGVSIPVRIHGGLAEPEIQVKLDRAAEERLQDEAEDKLKEKLRDKLGDEKAEELRQQFKGLKNLLGG